MLTEIAAERELHALQVSQRKKDLLEGAAAVFERIGVARKDEFDSTLPLLRTYPVPSANLPLPAASRLRRPNENKDRLSVTIPLENVREL